jgi:ADP-dependent NAD(P)H-hydrate dehydratase / NAD(P)H-hydrate epimerase
MRSAEEAAIAAGTPAEVLMERAGASLAEAAWRFSGAEEMLILCGPGNNGGDGYVAARHLAERGVKVRVAALSGPTTGAATWARGGWSGSVEHLDTVEPAALLIDCLFGTGLKRGLEPTLGQRLCGLAEAAALRIACDLPSGIDSDTGALLSPVPRFDMTVTFGALKPSHRLMPAMTRMGKVVLGDIGIDAAADWHEIGRPRLPSLDPAGHKYSRGMVAVLGGAMPGAAALAATAAARAGVGYVKLIADEQVQHVPAAVVQGQAADIHDERIGALLVGPGLGRDRQQLLDKALASGRPLILDADALTILGDPARLHGRDSVLTPHEGEFLRLFGDLGGSKPERALEAARMAQAIIIHKGADTLIASPDGRLGFSPPAPAWLASAGTGDVLAGIVAAFRARGMPSFEAACAAVWVHGRAAERAGPNMIADDLVAAIPDVL